MSREPTPTEILDRVKAIQADTAGVMEASRWAEWILERRFGATGTGIHTRVNSVQQLLGDDLVADLRYLASVRNDFAHNPMAVVRQPARFTATAQRALRQLLDAPVAPTAAPAAAAQRPSGRGTVPADGPGRRAAFAAVVAGFWALVVVGFWLANRTQPADAVPPSATTAPAPAPAVQQATEPDRPRSPRGAEATARPAQAPKARPALEQAPQPPASTATGAKPDAAELPADSGLSVEELRKLKSSL